MVEYPGGMDHVMNRGDQDKSIFIDDADGQRFGQTLERDGKGNTAYAATFPCAFLIPE